MRFAPLTSLLTAGLLACGLSAAADAQEPRGQMLDRMVGVAGTRPILLSEVLEELNARRQQGLAMPPDSAGQMALMLTVLNEIIDNEVVIAIAKQYKAEVTDEDVAKTVDERYNDAAKKFKSDAEFRDALRRDGFGTPEDFRRVLRDQAKRYKLQQMGYDSLRAHGRLSAPVQVTEAEVSAAFEAAKGRLQQKPATVSFRQIVLAPRANPTERLKALAKADSIAAEIRGGADFASVARRESMDPGSKELGGDLGYARRGSGFVPEFERALFDPRVVPMQLLPVVETSFGFHVIRVDRIQPAEVKARHILIMPKLDSNDVKRARALADTVLMKWSSGALTFDSLSALYHDRAEEKSVPDGYPVDSLPPIYKDAMEGVPTRGFTKPFEIPDPRTGMSKIGIIQVTERTEGGEYTVADYKDRIRSQLMQEKQIRRMLDQLRREQFVRILLNETVAPAKAKVVP